MRTVSNTALSLALAITIFGLSGNLFADGPGGSGGGDSTAQWAKATITKRFGDLKEAYGQNIIVAETAIPLDKIIALIDGTRIRVVKGPLLKDGKPVEALNYPLRNLIEIDKVKFESANRIRLLVHEVLGLIRIEDNTYKLSTELTKESDLLSDRLNFPFGSSYVEAHRAWAQSSFGSVGEAEKAIQNRSFACSWIGWASIGTGLRIDPNQWLSRADVKPEVQVSNNPLGRTVTIGMSSLFKRGSGGPSKLENGKVVTTFVLNGDSVKASVGKLGNKIILKVRDTKYSSFMDFETVNVCE